VPCEVPHTIHVLREVLELEMALWDRPACREVTAQAQPLLCNLGPCHGASIGAFWGRFAGFWSLLVPTFTGSPAHASQPRGVVPVPLPTMGMPIIWVTCPLSEKMIKSHLLASPAALSSVMVTASLFPSQVPLFLSCEVSVKCP